MADNLPHVSPVSAFRINTDHIQRKQFDIPYAALSPAQQLDIYWPDAGVGPFPVILAVHGGAYLGGDKADTQVVPMLAGLKRGYAVVSINYRLSGEALFPAPIQDVKAAIRWIRANAAQYQLNPAKIGAWGDSAGGHFVALAGTSAGVPELTDLTLGNAGLSDQIQAVVDWFGPTNFLTMDEQLAASGAPPEFLSHNNPDAPEALLLGAQITRIPDRVQASNPGTYITPAAPPFLIQHGTHDWIVPAGQSITLAAKLEAVVGRERVILELLDGAGHGGPEFETPENLNRVLDFFRPTLEIIFRVPSKLVANRFICSFHRPGFSVQTRSIVSVHTLGE
ncbi:MAG TPA: alpha/beta hydrolase [Phototrophicaceae bacterium]|nr:alpha/beta hydrolase [Phototrophicaceae bacterium]